MANYWEGISSMIIAEIQESSPAKILPRNLFGLDCVVRDEKNSVPSQEDPWKKSWHH